MTDDTSPGTRRHGFRRSWREKFDPDTERLYLDDNAAQSLPFIQATLVLLIAFYLVIGRVGDSHIAGMERGRGLDS